MDASVTETFLGEWKGDKRTGFGISERSDGLRYEGEWFNNKKYGYGVTTFRDGSKEEGKYKNNVLITSQKRRHIFLMRSAKFRERVDASVSAAQRASNFALQKADIAISRTATAKNKAELAEMAAEHAREDSEIAQQTARQFAPDFRQPGLERLRNREIPKYVPPPQDVVPGKSILQKSMAANATTSGPSIGDHSTTNSPMKATNADGGTANSGSAVGQPIRRASMRPAQQNQPMSNQNSAMQMQNQIPNAANPTTNQLPQAGINQNAYGQNPYQNQMPNTNQQPMPQNIMPNQYGNSLGGQYPQMGYGGGPGGPYGPGGGPSQFVVQGGQYGWTPPQQFENSPTGNQQQSEHYPGYTQQNPNSAEYPNQFQPAYSSQVKKTIPQLSFIYLQLMLLSGGEQFIVKTF